MVFTANDAKHLEVMHELSNKEMPEVDAKKLVENAVETKTSSSQLTANILNMCNSLRSEGFETYADALESKLVLFKIADTHLYRAHNEDGEDVINFAHPDGDHTVEDATDHNGDVETQLSQHKKIVDILHKQPTGKLASTKNILSMVKVALNIKNADNEAIRSTLNESLQKVTAAYELTKKTSDIGWFGKGRFENILTDIREKQRNISAENLFAIKKDIAYATSYIAAANHNIGQRYIDGLKDAFLNWEDVSPIDNSWERMGRVYLGSIKFVDELSVNQVLDLLNDASNLIDEAKQQLGVQSISEVPLSSPLASLRAQVNALIQKINKWRLNANIKADASLMTWINNESVALNTILKKYSSVAPADTQQQSLNMQKEIAAEAADIDAFESKYISATSQK
jgi:hypothetical protein